MNYVYINTITLWFKISVIKAKNNSHNITCGCKGTDIYLLGTTNFTKEQVQLN